MRCASIYPSSGSPRRAAGAARPSGPGALLSEKDGKIANPVEIIVRDHKAAVDALREVVGS